MVVRRTDSRRRRVSVAPEVSSISDEVAIVKLRPKPCTNAYSFGASRRNQPKTTDLFPKRVLSFCLLIAGILVVIVGINLLAYNAERWQLHLGQTGVAGLTMYGQGTLASWFSSFLLIISGLASLQIYALRQHRRDDYRGSYRLWGWMSLLCLVASVNCVVDLGAISNALVHSFTAFSFDSRPYLLLATKLVVLSTLVGRGLYEVRASRGAFGLVIFVWVAYSAAAILQLPSVQPAMVQLGHEMALGNCLLFATAGLLLTQLTFVRYIYLKANGLLNLPPVTVAKSQSKTKSKLKPRVKSSDQSESQPPTAATRKSNGTRSKGPGSTNATSSTRKKKRKSSTAESEKSVDRQQRSSKSKPKKNVGIETSHAAGNRSETETDDGEFEGVIKLSKSERRKRRKEEKRRRRAA